MKFSSPQASNGANAADGSPAVVSVGNNDPVVGVNNDEATDEAEAQDVDEVPVFLGRVYVQTHVTMTCSKSWVGSCGKTQQISGNNRHLVPKNMKPDAYYLRNVAKAILFHASAPYDEERLDEWVGAPENFVLVSPGPLHDIRNRRDHVFIVKCINKILDDVGFLHAQINMPSAWADVLRVSTIHLDMYLVVTKVYPFELEPGRDYVRRRLGYSLRVGFFDINHGVFYPCNEVGTSLFVGTDYRQFLYKSKKRKGITGDLNSAMKNHGGMYPWLDDMGKPHYRICEAAQIYRINRHKE